MKIIYLILVLSMLSVHILYAQPNSIELSTIHNGIGNSIGFNYKFNNNKLRYLLGLKYHPNVHSSDKIGISGNGHAFNFIQHFGPTIGIEYQLVTINNRVSLSAFYHNQLSILGYEYFVFDPFDYFYDPFVNKMVLGYSYDLHKVSPGLVIEQNIGLESNLSITDRIYVNESFGVGYMLYFNDGFYNTNNPATVNWKGAFNGKFILPFFKLGIEYTLKK